MFRGNSFRGSRLKGAEFNAKHPRGYRGRFIETPDQIKPSKKRLKKARLPQSETGSRRIALGNTTREQKLALLRKFLEAEALQETQVRREKVRKLLKARAYTGVDPGRKIVGGKPTIAKPEPKPEPAKKKTKKTSAEAIAAKAAKEAEKKAKAEAKEAEKKRKAEEKAQKEAEAKAAKEVEKQRKTEEKAAKAKVKVEEATLTKPTTNAPAKKVEALRKLLDVNYKDTPDLEYTPKYILNDEGLPKLPTAGRAHPPAKKSRIDFSDKGLEVWRDQPQYGKMQGKWKDIKDYEYKTELNGEEVTLNKNRLSVEFEGERVYGIPSIHTHLRETTDQKLFKDMARYMAYVENSGKVPPPSLSWVKTQHGIIYSDQVGYNKKPGEYGVCELHHHEQWARRKFSDITDKLTYNEKTKRFEDGEISVEEARRQMKELVEPMTEGGKDYLRIKLQDQSDRTVIVLPAGAHNATSKMYEALHPLGISLDGEPKRVKYGIPDTGEFGRETWFNGWNKRFWSEYYRREVYIMRQEIGRRMQKGDITKEQAEQYWQAGMDSVASTYKYKKYQSDNNTSIRKAIIKDFLDKNDAITTT